GRGGHEAPVQVSAAAPPPPIVFETAIPGDVPAPLPPWEVPPPADSEQTFDEGLWAGGDAGAGAALSGDAVIDPAEFEAGAEAAAASGGEPAPDEDYAPGWA